MSQMPSQIPSAHLAGVQVAFGASHAAAPDQFIEKFTLIKKHLLEELHKVIIGQDEVIELLMAAMFARATACWWAFPAWPRPS